MQRAATCLVNACLPDADPPCQQAAWVTNSTGVYDECLNNGAISSDFYGMYHTGVRVWQLGSWFSTWLYSLIKSARWRATWCRRRRWAVVFMLLIVALGLFLFAFLIGNMQNFLQSLSRRSFEHRLHLRDLEQWMSQRDIPRDLQRRVRQLERYVWTVNQGVNEEEVMTSLSEDIQRDVRRHLSLELITKHCVLLKGMPEQVLTPSASASSSGCTSTAPSSCARAPPSAACSSCCAGPSRAPPPPRAHGIYEEVILGKGDFVGEELLVYFIEKYAEESNKKHKLHSRRSMRRDMKVGSAVDAGPAAQVGAHVLLHRACGGLLVGGGGH
ncbi:hypothetical protein CLOM_g13184 [Closterium sp. NIES-68]|nr:hypothetical protein CLOM_g13184 [Closterium sp. NIES-68]